MGSISIKHNQRMPVEPVVFYLCRFEEAVRQEVLQVFEISDCSFEIAEKS